MTPKLLPLLVAAAVVGLAVPAAAQTTTTATASKKTSSPDAWASGVCSAVSTWLDAVDSTVKGLTSASSLDAAANQAKSGIQSATDTLETSIAALGVPSTGDGKKAKKQVDQLTDQLDSLSKSIQQLLGNPGSNPVQIAGTLAQVGADVGKAATEVKSTATALKGLKPNGALRQAFKTEPSCTQLAKRL
jgi:hypothetical protein